MAICENIATLEGDRPLLSRNLLAHARNLFEATAVRVQTGDGPSAFTYAALEPALAHIGSADKLVRFLHQFHKLVQISASHYTLDGDSSERLC